MIRKIVLYAVLYGAILYVTVLFNNIGIEKLAG